MKTTKDEYKYLSGKERQVFEKFRTEVVEELLRLYRHLEEVQRDVETTDWQITLYERDLEEINTVLGIENDLGRNHAPCKAQQRGHKENERCNTT